MSTNVRHRIGEIEIALPIEVAQKITAAYAGGGGCKPMGGVDQVSWDAYWMAMIRKTVAPKAIKLDAERIIESYDKQRERLFASCNYGCEKGEIFLPEGPLTANPCPHCSIPYVGHIHRIIPEYDSGKIADGLYKYAQTPQGWVIAPHGHDFLGIVNKWLADVVLSYSDYSRLLAVLYRPLRSVGKAGHNIYVLNLADALSAIESSSYQDEGGKRTLKQYTTGAGLMVVLADPSCKDKIQTVLDHRRSGAADQHTWVCWLTPSAKDLAKISISTIINVG